MTPRVKEAKTLSDYKIFIAFENVGKNIFDLKPYLEYEV